MQLLNLANNLENRKNKNMRFNQFFAKTLSHNIKMLFGNSTITEVNFPGRFVGNNGNAGKAKK